MENRPLDQLKSRREDYPLDDARSVEIRTDVVPVEDANLPESINYADLIARGSTHFATAKC